MITLFSTAFLLGLTSNLHCVGMCGPIALSVPLDRSSSFRMWIGIFQYNFGRISVYGVLGMLTGFIGLSISTFGFLQWASIISGVIMVLYAWRKQLGQLLPRFNKPLILPANAMSFVVKRTGVWKLVLLGGLNGILPCGMVYLGLINALLSPSPFIGMATMLLFGIGTLPIMISVVFMANAITTSVRKRFSSSIPYVLTVLGVLIILRGSNLGIPYLSPTVIQKSTRHIHADNHKFDVSCCSNPKKEIKSQP